MRDRFGRTMRTLPYILPPESLVDSTHTQTHLFYCFDEKLQTMFSLHLLWLHLKGSFLITVTPIGIHWLHFYSKFPIITIIVTSSIQMRGGVHLGQLLTRLILFWSAARL